MTARRALTAHLDELIERLQTKNLVQLHTAREALVLIGPPARERLIYILGTGHVYRRQDAAYVLGMMSDRAAVEPLCAALHHPDPLLRMICVQALGKIGDPSAAEALRRAMGDPDTKVAAEARKAHREVGAASGG